MTGGAAPLSVAVASVFQEGNAFGAVRCGVADFAASTLVAGPDVGGLADSPCEVGGALDELGRAGARVVPAVVARAASGGVLTAGCWRELRDRILDALCGAGPLHAVLLAMHGSMVAEGCDDPEGTLLADLRRRLPDGLPVVVTLDSHATITAAMVRHATALVPYHAYPHDDGYDTGVRAARLALRLAAGAQPPGMTFVRLPMLSPAANGSTTGDGPMARLAALCGRIREDSGLADLAVVQAHPHNDLPETGNGVLAVGGTVRERRHAAVRVARAYWALRFALEAPVHSVPEAVAAAAHGLPVVIADWSDCVGGGGTGDSVWPLRALLGCELAGEAHLSVVDPVAAATALAAGAGSTVDLTVGHRLDPVRGDPLPVRAVVESVHPDAAFRYGGGPYGGARGRMGDTAVLRIGDRIRLLVTSLRGYEWRGEQYAAAGLDPRRARYIVVKNPVNFRHAYAALTDLFVPVTLPGATTPRLRDLPYRRVPRPFFPLDFRAPGAVPPLAVIEPDPAGASGAAAGPEPAAGPRAAFAPGWLVEPDDGPAVPGSSPGGRPSHVVTSWDYP